VNAAIEAAPDWARAMLESERVAHLGLLDDRDLPRILPITFALYDGALWSAVDRKPKARPGGDLARLRYLRRRPDIALTVDHYEDDWTRLAWVQVLGEASIHNVDECEGAFAALAAKYHQYHATPPPGPLIRIEPTRVLSWRACAMT
jgi:PPOX class probable F420-dependent enzyme